jgi:HEAT repeat protein
MKATKISSMVIPLTTATVLLVSCGVLGTVAADAPDNYLALVQELIAKDGSCNVGNSIDYLDTPENPLPVAPLLPLLNHQSPQVRWGAAYTLRLMQNRKQCSANLLEAAGKEQNSFALTEMVQGLGATRHTAATPLLSELMRRHDSAEVRYAAVEAEYWIRDTNAVPALIQVTGDATDQVALRALYVLGHIGDKRAVTRLIEVAKQDDRKKLLSAVQALGMIGAAEAAPVLRSFLSTQDVALLKQVVWALGRAHDGPTVKSLLPLLSHNDKAIAEETRLSLLEIGTDEVLELFIGRYKKDADDATAFGIIRSLYGQGSRKIGEPLTDFSQTQMVDLAKHLSAFSQKEVKPVNIKSVRRAYGALFVQIVFEDTAFDAIVIQENDGAFKSGKVILSWFK